VAYTFIWSQKLDDTILNEVLCNAMLGLPENEIFLIQSRNQAAGNIPQKPSAPGGPINSRIYRKLPKIENLSGGGFIEHPYDEKNYSPFHRFVQIMLWVDLNGDKANLVLLEWLSPWSFPDGKITWGDLIKKPFPTLCQLLDSLMM